MKFEVGKKYRNYVTRNIFDCIFVSPNGKGVLVRADGEEYYVENNSSFSEYKEPRKLTISIWVTTGGDLFASTSDVKYHGRLLDTIEWVEEV